MGKKYEPRSLDEMILHPGVRNKLENVLREPKNVILFGTTGVGKGTFTNILLKETSADNLCLNASDDAGIDTIREKVKSFAQSPSINNFFDRNSSNSRGRFDEFRHLKIVVFNEAEGLSKKAKNFLKELMEKEENLCKFIFMTNEIKNFDRAVQSRCTLVEITKPPKPDILRFIENITSVRFRSS